jgi:hypothetical protein
MTEALIRLRLSELEYDVAFDTWSRGNTLDKPNEKVIYKKDKMQDWLLRQIENAVGEIKAALRWCVDDHAHMTDDEIMDAPESWEIHFKWQGQWKGSESGLKTFAHQYVVNKALADWYEKIGMSFDSYLAKAAVALESMKNSARKNSVSTNFRL